MDARPHICSRRWKTKGKEEEEEEGKKNIKKNMTDRIYSLPLKERPKIIT